MYKAYDDYTDVYVRDAGGNIIAIYKSGEVSGYETDSLREFHIYGSSRLGIQHINKVAATTAPGGPDLLRTRGERRKKSFELTNHLGNVLTTISDLKQGSDDDMNGIADIYHAGLESWADYYPFGMEMAGRTGVSGNTSRFGFNSKEKDLSMSSLTHYDYGFRVYNPAVGRFLSVDPLTSNFPSWTPYHYVHNNPVLLIDPTGMAADTFVPSSDRPLIYEAGFQEWAENVSDDTEMRYTWTERLYILGSWLSLASPTARVMKGSQYIDDVSRTTNSSDEIVKTVIVSEEVTEGIVRSRINIANGTTRFTPLRSTGKPVSAGWAHVVSGHFNRAVGNNRSIFTLGQDEVKCLLQCDEVVNSPVTAISGGQFVRTVDVGYQVGISSINQGGKATNYIQVITDRAGNLITTYPVGR